MMNILPSAPRGSTLQMSPDRAPVLDLEEVLRDERSLFGCHSGHATLFGHTEVGCNRGFSATQDFRRAIISLPGDALQRSQARVKPSTTIAEKRTDPGGGSPDSDRLPLLHV